MGKEILGAAIKSEGKHRQQPACGRMEMGRKVRNETESGKEEEQGND